MADADIQIPVTGTGDTGPKKVDTRTVGAGSDEHRQVVVVGDPSTAAGVAGVDASNGLDVDVTRIGAGDNVIGRVKLTDGTEVAEVRNVASGTTYALDVAIVDGSGGHVTSFAGSGGTASDDNSSFTPGTTPGTPAMGVYQSSPSSVTDGRLGTLGIDANRNVKVTLQDVAASIDPPHDDPDAGAPAKIGAQARSSLPTAVANADRANAISDLFGRIMVGHIPPEAQVWKRYNTTTQATGATIWDPTAGKRIAITHFTIGSRDSTADSGLVQLWFGANGDTTYDAGTDQLVFEASFAPSASVMPGAVVCPATPIYCLTADYELHITTNAALSVDIAVYGYEF